MDNRDADAAANQDSPISTADLAQAMEARRAEQSVDAAPPVDAPLLANSEVADLRTRWDQVQTGFVDAPRQAVEHADALVASAMQRIAETFAAERSRLESAWDRGGDVSTEDLRIALQRYRSFFTRLLSI